MKRLFISALFVLVGIATYAAAPGATCSTAKPLVDNFREEITVSPGQEKVVWYSAWTFDLPLTVYFAPANETDPAPIVEMDFSCTSGFYTDSILCSLFCKTGGSSGIDMNMPHKPALTTDRLPDGTLVYYLSLGKKYRDLLLQMGISYNLEVFVKVTFKCSGVISIAPNDLFSNCMDGFKFMHLDDTVEVKTKDKNRHVIVPYVQWQEDSIRYVWEGTSDVKAAVGYACSYDPTDNGDETILDIPTLHAPKDTLKLTSEELKHYVKEANSEAGMFFAKFYTEGTGVIKIEQVPQAPPQGGATLLKYDRATHVDTAKLYAIPYTWTTATRFDVPTDYIFRMYIGNTYDFKKENALASYQFSRNDAGHWLGIPEAEMKALWTHTQEQYLYVRFECNTKTTITPTLWKQSDCVLGSTLLENGKTYIINSKSNTIYRIYYNDWKDGDMSVAWNQAADCKWLISGGCEIGTNQNKEEIIDYTIMQAKTTYTKSSSRIISRWGPHVDPDGYIYMRFYTTKSTGGQITVSTNAPEETDPQPEQYPKATISVTCAGVPTSSGQSYTIQVSEEQDLSIGTENWHQKPSDAPHQITLPSGTHTLQGAKESVRIIVP